MQMILNIVSDKNGSVVHDHEHPIFHNLTVRPFFLRQCRLLVAKSRTVLISEVFGPIGMKLGGCMQVSFRNINIGRPW